jgi:tetratricopeptide (TPR) repeat protein
MRAVRFVAAIAALGVAGCGTTTPAVKPEELRAKAEAAFLGGQFLQAADGFRQLAEASPADRPWALLQQGRSLNGAEQWEPAAKAFTDAIAARPPEDQRLQALYFRSFALAGAARYPESLADLRVLDSTPQSLRGQAVKEDEFRYRFALARIRAGDWTGGQLDLKAFVSAFPQSPLLAEARDRLVLKGVVIVIGRARDAGAAKGLVAEARAKGFTADPVQGPRDQLVVVGPYRSAAEARTDLPRVQVAWRDAYIAP